MAESDKLNVDSVIARLLEGLSKFYYRISLSSCVFNKEILVLRYSSCFVCDLMKLESIDRLASNRVSEV